MSYFEQVQFKNCKGKFNKEKLNKVLQLVNSERLFGGWEGLTILHDVNQFEMSFDDGDYFRAFKNTDDLMILLSETLDEGEFVVLLEGEQIEQYGYRVTPKKVQYLECEYVPVGKEMTLQDLDAALREKYKEEI